MTAISERQPANFYKYKKQKIRHVFYTKGQKPCKKQDNFGHVYMYCTVEVESSLLAKYVNVIGQLAKFVRALNSFKMVLRYFGQV